MITVVSVKGLRTPADRARVAYVGRAFAGWPASPLGNPFKGPDAVAHFAHWLTNHPDRVKLLGDVWEKCGRGKLPLGCWCIGSLRWPWYANRIDTPECHAQIVALQICDLVKAGELPPRDSA